MLRYNCYIMLFIALKSPEETGSLARHIARAVGLYRNNHRTMMDSISLFCLWLLWISVLHCLGFKHPPIAVPFIWNKLNTSAEKCAISGLWTMPVSSSRKLHTCILKENTISFTTRFWGTAANSLNYIVPDLTIKPFILNTEIIIYHRGGFTYHILVAQRWWGFPLNCGTSMAKKLNRLDCLEENRLILSLE